MAYNSLREFVRLLDARGELARILTPVSAALEITEIVDRVSKGPAGHNKALLFENVRGSDMPVLINMFGSAHRMAWALPSTIWRSSSESGDAHRSETAVRPAVRDRTRHRHRQRAARRRDQAAQGPPRAGAGDRRDGGALARPHTHPHYAGPRMAGRSSRCRRSSPAIRSRARATWGCTACRKSTATRCSSTGSGTRAAQSTNASPSSRDVTGYRRHRPGRRSGVHLGRVRAAATRHRRVLARGLAAREVGALRQVRHAAARCAGHR